MNKRGIAFGIIIAALISGCANPFQSSTYDPNEYGALVSVLTQAEQHRPYCDGTVPIADMMVEFASRADSELHYLENYARYRAVENTPTVEIVKTLRSNIQDVGTKYEDGAPSQMYCQIKLDNIIEQTKAALNAVQSKVR